MGNLSNIVAFSDVRVVATVTPPTGGSFELEISSVDMEFEENAIPRAVLKIALGSSLQPGGRLKVAKAHAKVKQLERRSAITVKATIKGHETTGKRWDSGEFVIFDGYMSRPAYTMGTQAASLVIEVDHWLVDLAATTKFSYLIANATPANYTRPAVIAFDTLSGEAGGNESAALDGIGVLYKDIACSDLWQAIEVTFRQLANQERLNVSVISAMIGDDAAIRNEIALRALDRMNKSKKANKVIGLSGATLQGVLSGLAEKYNNSLATRIAGVHSGSSFWETLVSLSREYVYSVIPTINTAECVPLVKTVKEDSSNPMLRIDASEYNQIQVQTNIRALPIRSVGLYGHIGMETMSTDGLGEDKTKIEKDLYGYWDLTLDSNDPDTREGQMLLQTAPAWMWELTGTLGKYAAGNLPRFGPINCLSNVKGGGKPPEQDGPNKEREEELTRPEEDHIGNKFAKVILGDVTWADRVGSITGRLRFDIAPGTPIKLETVGKNVPFYQQSGDTILHAHVYKVGISINATTPSATTTLTMSHMRTDAENEKFSSIVVSEHPIYTNLWRGTSLLDPED